MSRTILAVQPFEDDNESDIDDNEGFQFSGSAATNVTRNRDQEVAAAADCRPSRIVLYDGWWPLTYHFQETAYILSGTPGFFSPPRAGTYSPENLADAGEEGGSDRGFIFGRTRPSRCW
ncbi:hypothetical protein CYMTET_36615 [Cymbomonas tetramitiformis]|uniref:Uncharacterized protein n=1 Tax=Cymbomonas tetramitiformis TaxID=36881 RepID=A0AAE0CGZ0_9CHLO|nr:hypothetical protein CYMTET_36615 [Cymbomonas tetramitiformis]